jgi:hypothetical protein
MGTIGYTTAMVVIKRAGITDQLIVDESPLTREDLQKMANAYGGEDFLKNIDELPEDDHIFFPHSTMQSLVKHDEKIFLKRLNTVRIDNDSGNKIKDWDISLESDGTRRAIDLLPILPDIRANNCDNVYIMDFHEIKCA